MPGDPKSGDNELGEPQLLSSLAGSSPPLPVWSALTVQSSCDESVPNFILECSQGSSPQPKGNAHRWPREAVVAQGGGAAPSLQTAKVWGWALSSGGAGGVRAQCGEWDQTAFSGPFPFKPFYDSVL